MTDIVLRGAVKRLKAIRLPPVTSTVAATTVGQLAVFLTAALAHELRADISFSTADLGIAVAAFFASSSVCSSVSGRLSDRLGGTCVMAAGVAITVAALTGMAVAVHTDPMLIIMLVVAGCANGIIQPAANRYLMESISLGQRGFAFGVKQAALPAATLLSGLSVPVTASAFGWRSAFGCGAALALGVAFLVRPARGRPHRPRRPGPPVIRPFDWRALTLLTIGVGAGSAAATAMGAFLVVYAVHVGLGGGWAGLIAAIGSLCSLTVRLALGVYADRHVAGHLKTVAFLCALGAVGLSALAVGPTWLLLPSVLIGYGAGWGWAGLFTFAIASTHIEAPGLATGITMTGGSGGASLGPLCFGFVAATVGYRPAWIGTTATMVLAAGVILLGRQALLGRRLPRGQVT